MTSEKMYEKLMAYVATRDETERTFIDKIVKTGSTTGDPGGPCLLADLLIQLRADIRDAANKAAGSDKKRLYTLAKALIKNAKAHSHESIAGAIVQGDDVIFTDGFRLLFSKDTFGLPDAPDLGRPTFDHVYRCLEEGRTYSKELPLPDAGQLKAHIADRKAAGDKRRCIMYDFGRGLPAFSAEYLLDFARAMPGAVIKWDQKNGATYIKDPESGAEGVLLPVRKKDES